MLDTLGPAHVRNVDKSVDAGLDLHEGPERSQIPHRTAELRTRRVLHRQCQPRIFLDLLHTERNLLVVRIDLEHHRLDVLSNRNDLRGVPHVTGPGHLRDVDQTLDALLKLDEGTIVRNRDDTAPNTRTDRILLVDIGPRVWKELLESERDALAVPIDVENLHIDLGADIYDLGRMSDATP